MAVPKLKLVRKESVRNQVFHQLKEQIIRHTWAPGERIPSENELSQTMGVSRITVRETLQMLASLGLVETRQGGGTFVRAYSGEVLLSPLLPMMTLETIDVLHVLEYRKIMERGAARLAAERAGEEDIRKLEAMYATMQSTRDDVHAFARADLEFHLIVARSTRNPIFIKVASVIKDVLSASMDEIVRDLGTSVGLHYHAEIIAAIKARDEERAQAMMEEHVERTIDLLRKSLLKKGEKEKH